MSRVVAAPDLVQRCRTLAADLGRAGVGGLRPSRSELAAEQFGRNDEADRLMVALARLAFDLALLTEEAGSTAMVSPDREEHWVRRLFEKAVHGFAKIEFAAEGWDVRGGVPLQWPADGFSAGMRAILPRMVTDIVVTTANGSRLVIDTKFTSVLHSGHFGTERLRSGYLYQMYAYLRTQEERSPAWSGAAGLLLHPATGFSLHESANIQGHAIHTATVDLTATAPMIRSALRDTIGHAVGRPCIQSKPHSKLA